VKKIILAAGAIFVIIALQACKEKTTGEKLDDAIDSAQEKTEKAWDGIKKAIED